MIAETSNRIGALQLAFDVTPPPRKRKITPRNPSPAKAPVSKKESKDSLNIRKRSPSFHMDGSSIASDRFSLKFLSGDRSYMIQGAYRIHEGRSRYDAEEQTTIEGVRVDRIYAYRNGSYVFIPASKTERERFERAAFEVLADPRYNDSFSEKS